MQVGFGPTRETKRGHLLRRPSGKLDGLSDTRKDVPLGNTARVTLVDGDPERHELGLMLLLRTLQVPQRIAHNLAGVIRNALS